MDKPTTQEVRGSSSGPPLRKTFSELTALAIAGRTEEVILYLRALTPQEQLKFKNELERKKQRRLQKEAQKPPITEETKDKAYAAKKPVVAVPWFDFNAEYVRVLHDYEGDDVNKLPIKRNQVVTIRSRPYHNWWVGRVAGREGLFPSNYVKEITPNGQVVVTLFDFGSPKDTHLTFSKGEKIVVVDEEAGWMSGIMGERWGRFPSNYVSAYTAEMMENDGRDSKRPGKSSDRKKASKTSSSDSTAMAVDAQKALKSKKPKHKSKKSEKSQDNKLMPPVVSKPSKKEKKKKNDESSGSSDDRVSERLRATEERLKLKETELKQKEEICKRQEELIGLKMEEVKLKHKDVLRKEAEIKEKEAQLVGQGGGETLQKRLDAVNEKERQLDVREAKLEARESKAEALEVKLAARAERLDERERLLDARTSGTMSGPAVPPVATGVPPSVPPPPTRAPPKQPIAPRTEVTPPEQGSSSSDLSSESDASDDTEEDQVKNIVPYKPEDFGGNRRAAANATLSAMGFQALLDAKEGDEVFEDDEEQPALSPRPPEYGNPPPVPDMPNDLGDAPPPVPVEELPMSRVPPSIIEPEDLGTPPVVPSLTPTLPDRPRVISMAVPNRGQVRPEEDDETESASESGSFSESDSDLTEVEDLFQKIMDKYGPKYPAVGEELRSKLPKLLEADITTLKELFALTSEQFKKLGFTDHLSKLVLQFAETLD